MQKNQQMWSVPVFSNSPSGQEELNKPTGFTKINITFRGKQLIKELTQERAIESVASIALATIAVVLLTPLIQASQENTITYTTQRSNSLPCVESVIIYLAIC